MILPPSSEEFGLPPKSAEQENWKYRRGERSVPAVRRAGLTRPGAGATRRGMEHRDRR